ncbi:MAG TPA: monofunctional biosynthetic peptidoglycan transglycosylase [Vicinamibacterales bacterium]|nr:monofunctional biosynthetic peptidoglycan transglycosylase [Vicinamibacterales bacterium]
MRRGRRIRAVGRVLLIVLAAAFGCVSYVYLSLPDVRVLRTRNPETTAFMALREREARARGDEPRRVHRWVRYGRISPNLTRAVLVAEDSAFWQHDGVDYQQLRESMETNLERMEFARGASTITQQLAKNLYLTPSKNPVRKARELVIARRLEAELTKRRILEIYLNVIEWGPGIYGAEAAARTYFRKTAADLSPQESALLAAAIINPRLLDPGRPTARLRRRQQMVLRRMGAVTPPPAVEPGEAGDPPSEPVPRPSDGAPPVLPGQVLPVPGPGGGPAAGSSGGP